MVSDVCLSRTSGLSREQRHRKTKIGTKVAHVTRDTTFKVKRSKVKITCEEGPYCGGLPPTACLLVYVSRHQLIAGKPLSNL